MLRSLKSWRMPAYLVFATCLAGAPQVISAQELAATAQDASDLPGLWRLPLFTWFSPLASLVIDVPAPPPPPCLVEPISEISDPDALQFEAAAGSVNVVNVAGLTPATSRALTRFERLVTSAGGSIVVTSAYRPAAYQVHLQELWDKWMVELRDNADLACAPLREQVGADFVRHGLLESQRPATYSDHVIGRSFDAAVILPSRARLKRRRVGIDSLARMAGIRRPVIASDPVHFRLM